MKTWQVKLADGRTIDIKAAKADAQALMHDINKVTRIGQYCRELYGIVGEDDKACVLYYPFGTGGAALQDAEAYEKDKANLLASIPDLVTGVDFTRIRTLAAKLFDKHVPVLDKRTTPEQETERNEKVHQAELRREQDAATWRAEHCLVDPVELPADSMAVFLEITFDNSEPMTDYYSPHASLGQDMLLAVVPKQRETERLMRSVLARYPELSKLSWTWHTENYSMGHGNYLMSETFGSVKHKAYDGREEVAVRYEISANKWVKGMMYAWKEYPGNVAVPSASEGGNGKATVTLNEERNGVEVRFPSKPVQEILDSLKAAGFKWSGRQGLWWARQSEETLSVAQGFAE